MKKYSKIIGISNLIYNKEKKNARQSILSQIVGVIISMIIIYLFSKLLNYRISLYMVIFYVYVRPFSSSNAIASRVLSKSVSGIYENLLCSGVTLNELMFLETINSLRKEIVSILFSILSVGIIFIVLNYKYFSNILVALSGIIAMILLSLVMHVIVYAFSVIRTINRGNVGLLSLFGIGSGFCILVDMHWYYKVALVLLLTVVLLIITKYFLTSFRFENNKV